MNPFSPPPGPYPTNHGPQTGFPFPTNDGPPAGMPFGTIDGPPAGMQYPTYYGSMPGMRGPTTTPSRPRPARKKRMILPVLGGGFVGAVVLATVIGLQVPERYLTPADERGRPGRVPRGGHALGSRPAAGRLLQRRPAPARSGHQHADQHGRGRPVRVTAHRPGDRQGRYSPTDTLVDVRANRAGADCEGELRQKVADATLTDPSYSRGTLVPADDTTWTAGHTIACVVMSDAPRTGSALK